MTRTSFVGSFATRQTNAIIFIVLVMCLAGVYCAVTMPSSVFPQTNFPRVVILIDNGIMPADEMMATITRPIEEAMKAVPGTVSIRSTTGRGSADINVFFDWNVDMTRSELFVMSRLAEVRSSLPSTVEINSYRLTFSAFPIIGISLTSPSRGLTDLWETAQYRIKPRFLRIPGVARVDLVGGRTPEYHVVVDPARLRALNLSLAQVTDAIAKSNLVAPAGMHEENHTLYLTLVDGRVHSVHDIENLAVTGAEGRVVRVRDFAQVRPAQEPVFNVVTAEGVNAVLLNVRSQPDGSTLEIADRLKAELAGLRRELPPDMKLAFFYDQSLLVRQSVRSVWDAIVFGLLLSIVIVYLFLRSWGTTAVAIVVIPVAVLITFVAMRLLGMSFNLMTLGGVAAAIGLVIDDAIVVVEAIYTSVLSGRPRGEAIETAMGQILLPLIGSTLTPVVVFIPLAFLSGVAGVFFRALAITMAVALLSSLLLAVTLTPSLAGWMVRTRRRGTEHSDSSEGGPILRRVVSVYELAVRQSLRHRWIAVGLCVLLLLGGAALYFRLSSDFLPVMDEGGFVIDYVALPGTSLSETNRQLLEVETILKQTAEIDSYSRRTGAALGFHLVEPNTGDFLVKLKPGRERATQEVIADLREKLQASQPSIQWEFPGILSDLIGDLTWSPEPVEIKLISTDLEFLKRKAPEVEDAIKSVPGIVDSKDGLIIAGPSISLRVRAADAQQFGLNADDVATAVSTALFGRTASSVLEGDRTVAIRVIVDPKQLKRVDKIRELPIRSPTGTTVLLSQVADVREEPGELELRRDDLRQTVAVTARLEGRDLGGAMQEIREKLGHDPTLPPGTVEYGGLYEQQRESFRNLLVVLTAAVLLVFIVLLLEFGSYRAPLAVVLGSVLALIGSVLALWLTGTSLNIISFLGAIIGVGIVAKNGILMLDSVEHLRAEGLPLEEALVRSGRRRLRPVLMTSFAAALGMLPLAYGVGSGADMLRPLAVAVIGALSFSVIFSLVATPTFYLALANYKPPSQSTSHTRPSS